MDKNVDSERIHIHRMNWNFITAMLCAAGIMMVAHLELSGGEQQHRSRNIRIRISV